MQQTPSTKCIGEISKALENFSQIQSDLPQNYHRLEELKKDYQNKTCSLEIQELEGKFKLNIKKINDNQLNKHDQDNKPWTKQDLVSKLVDCCEE